MIIVLNLIIHICMIDFRSLNVKVWVWDKGENKIYTKSSKQ